MFCNLDISSFKCLNLKVSINNYYSWKMKIDTNYYLYNLDHKQINHYLKINTLLFSHFNCYNYLKLRFIKELERIHYKLIYY